MPPAEPIGEVDQALASERAAARHWADRVQVLRVVERSLGTPAAGPHTALAEHLAAWTVLSLRPSDRDARVQVLRSAEQVAASLTTLRRAIADAAAVAAGGGHHLADLADGSLPQLAATVDQISHDLAADLATAHSTGVDQLGHLGGPVLEVRSDGSVAVPSGLSLERIAAGTDRRDHDGRAAHSVAELGNMGDSDQPSVSHRLVEVAHQVGELMLHSLDGLRATAVVLRGLAVADAPVGQAPAPAPAAAAQAAADEAHTLLDELRSLVHSRDAARAATRWSDGEAAARRAHQELEAIAARAHLTAARDAAAHLDAVERTLQALVGAGYDALDAAASGAVATVSAAADRAEAAIRAVHATGWAMHDGDGNAYVADRDLLERRVAPDATVSCGADPEMMTDDEIDFADLIRALVGAVATEPSDPDARRSARARVEQAVAAAVSGLASLESRRSLIRRAIERAEATTGAGHPSDPFEHQLAERTAELLADSARETASEAAASTMDVPNWDLHRFLR